MLDAGGWPSPGRLSVVVVVVVVVCGGGPPEFGIIGGESAEA